MNGREQMLKVVGEIFGKALASAAERVLRSTEVKDDEAMCRAMIAKHAPSLSWFHGKPAHELTPADVDEWARFRRLFDDARLHELHAKLDGLKIERDAFASIAQLRHLYEQMVNGRVSDCAEAARGLLGPAIERLERALADRQAP